MEAKKWIENYKYLPTFMRDFHDQKNLFKAIDESLMKEWDTVYVEKPAIDTAMSYTIDYFLFFMACHGYSLQKTKIKVEGQQFDDIEETVERYKQARIQNTINKMEKIFGKMEEK